MHCGYCDEKYAKCDEEVITELNENVVEHILSAFLRSRFFLLYLSISL